MRRRVVRSTTSCNSIASWRHARYVLGLMSSRARQQPFLRSVVLSLLLSLAGCARLLASPSPPDVTTIAVFPVDNRTGSEVYADAPPIAVFFGYPNRQRVTAADILTDAFARELSSRGFRVVAPPGAASGETAVSVASAQEAARRLAEAEIHADGLYVRLRRWNPAAASHLLYVDVMLDATLVSPDGRILWTAELPAVPIDGGGSSSVALGYPEVARRVAELVVANLRPAAR